MGVKLNRRRVKVLMALREIDDDRTLAQRAGLSKQTLYSAYNGNSFTMDTLAKIAKALDCHPTDILEMEGFPAPLVGAPEQFIEQLAAA